MQAITKTTLPKEKLDYLIENNNTISINKLAKELGASRWTIISNRYALGLTSKKKQAKVIDFDNNGYFDVDEFGKLYNY